MIKQKDKLEGKNRHDAEVTDNSFTRAVKKAGAGGTGNDRPRSGREEAGEKLEIPLKAKDELTRAQEAPKDTTTESERFRRDK